MSYKNNSKKYLKFNLLTILVLFLFSYPILFIQKVDAYSNELLALKVYSIAWNVINEKFYFKSKINLNKWNDRLNNNIYTLEDAHKRINKLIKNLKDPYTRFLTREEFKDEQDILNSSLTGIGVKLAINKPIVLDVLPESPAHDGDIQSNDYILNIDNKSTRGLDSKEITNLIRGPKNTTLTIRLKRGKNIITKTLERKELNFKAVLVEELDSNLALVKISSFIPENTSELFKNEILKLTSSNGIIIDLRNNSGGLVKNAIDIADMFLSEGKIVSTVSNLEKTTQYANSSKLCDSKVVILVNENTASASEILTSALKENKRAVVIGKKTFGKGLVQEIVKLPDDSAMHVTIASYLTPSGKNIDKVGLVPDEVIYDEDKQLERAKEILAAL